MKQSDPASTPTHKKEKKGKESWAKAVWWSTRRCQVCTVKPKRKKKANAYASCHCQSRCLLVVLLPTPVPPATAKLCSAVARGWGYLFTSPVIQSKYPTHPTPWHWTGCIHVDIFILHLINPPRKPCRFGYSSSTINPAVINARTQKNNTNCRLTHRKNPTFSGRNGTI